VREAALANEAVKRHVEGKTVKKVVVVPGRLVNIVVG
jgi:leucyl-tRNA synthetase